MAFAVLPALLAASGDRKQASGPATQLEISGFGVRRTPQGVIEIDGRVRNTGERAIARGKLVFYLLSPEGSIVSTQKGAIDPEVLEPGDDSQFFWQARDVARAISVRIGAVDHKGNPIAILNEGPYPIE